MYCGIGKIPKNKIRGTPEYCLEANQVRYYGLKKIDPDLLSMTTSKKSNLVKEQLKLKRLQDDAKILIKEVKNVDLVLNDDMARESNVKRARKRKDELLVKRDKLVTKIKAQREVVKKLEKRESDQQSKSSSSKSSSSRSSGSKSSSSRSSGSKSSSSRSSGSKSSGSKSKR
ncbi:hypothetical protein ma585 [Moumouvirus australiensis]|uniref:Uncharacterized protein n=1 Tax=Moumouvirus australiensis TaxID=2109587 RepID=A0A2P1EM63_9VIRU|nr:hypothetical protein QKC55_gp320 [Moumouvirus australiensis]AVL94971.1 hypothetical protein ma585 [Moumouvirus australiensis]